MPKARLALLALALAVIVGFSIVVKLNNGGKDVNPSAGGVSAATTTAEGTKSEASPPTKAPPTVAPANFKMEKLAPGQKPPQFVLFSFDGAGSHEKWQMFMAAAAKVKAQFTGFLTGIYLLDNDHKMAYTGPGHAPGKASVSFGGTQQDIYTLVDDLNKAKAAGMEIGTHYNGHFCAGSEPSGKDWNTDQWNSELDQFFRFLANYPVLNGYTDAPKLNVVPQDIKGGRTPCLEGSPPVFFPALASHKLLYDTSSNMDGIGWPRKIDNIWEFDMPRVKIIGTEKMNIAMDYNFWYALNQGADEPARAPEFAKIVLDTYNSMYTAAFNGNRAPLVIGNHFNSWSGDAFNPAVSTFMAETCAKPETVCTTYQNVIKWMSLQDPAVLAQLLAQPRVMN